MLNRGHLNYRMDVTILFCSFKASLHCYYSIRILEKLVTSISVAAMVKL